MKRMWLVGMPGSGKTTVGRALAARLGVGFIDTDELVETLAGQTISELWTTEGETRFRDLERMVIAGLKEAEGVIATGGGAVLDADSRETMTGTVVWLEATPETLTGRLDGGADRPVLNGADAVNRTLLVRSPIYRAVADHRVATDDRPVDDIVDELADKW